MFDTPLNLALGLVTGVCFGFLLQKGRAAKFEVIIGQFLLKDWTVFKIMLTAVAVGALGVWALVGTGETTLSIKPAAFGGVVVGAILFGIGMALFGYCPGTSVAACGEGRRDAMIGVAGMLVGALIYVVAYPSLQGIVQGWGNAGEATLPSLTKISPWVFVAALCAAVIVLRLVAAPNGSLPRTKGN